MRFTSTSTGGGASKRCCCWAPSSCPVQRRRSRSGGCTERSRDRRRQPKTKGPVHCSQRQKRQLGVTAREPESVACAATQLEATSTWQQRRFGDSRGCIPRVGRGKASMQRSCSLGHALGGACTRVPWASSSSPVVVRTRARSQHTTRCFQGIRD